MYLSWNSKIYLLSPKQSIQAFHLPRGVSSSSAFLDAQAELRDYSAWNGLLWISSPQVHARFCLAHLGHFLVQSQTDHQTTMRNSFGPYFLCSLLLGAAQVAYGGLISRPSYIFNRTSTKNVAVYFGQSPVTSSTSLAAQCADPSIDIVILAFVIDQLHGGLYPSVNFGAACGGQTALMASSAPGLLSCPALAADILTCQKTYGRKVLLSVGGATSTIAFASDQQASTFANVLWKIFGPPGQVDVGLRPFGTVEVDGFDIGKVL